MVYVKENESHIWYHQILYAFIKKPLELIWTCFNKMYTSNEDT